MCFVPCLVAATGLDAKKLLFVVPFVERPGLVQPLIALQTDQFGVGRGREGLGELGLAHAGRSFDQQRLTKPVREENRRRYGVVSQVTGRPQPVVDVRHIGKGVLL